MTRNVGCSPCPSLAAGGVAQPPAVQQRSLARLVGISVIGALCLIPGVPSSGLAQGSASPSATG